MKYLSISRDDTNVLKGIAICAMLFHHLYCCSPEGVEQYTGFLFYFGVLGTVCASIFLFCSGYGLAANYEVRKDQSIKGSVAFVARRFMRFYTNYWFILLIFVPISIFCFGRTFEVAYAGLNIPKRMVLEVFAMNSYSSYNITWWFNALIVMLYLLFPIIFWFVKKLGLAFVALSLVIFWFYNYIPGNYAEIYFWQFSFVIGVYWSIRVSKNYNLAAFFEKYRVLCMVISVVLILVLVLIRIYNCSVGHCVRTDLLLTCVIVILVVLTRNTFRLSSWLGFLGKHSMNIYLTHTFVNGYWHPQWLHTGEMRSGLNFVVLLLICLAMSMVLEGIKKKCGIYSLVNRMSERILP